MRHRKVRIDIPKGWVDGALERGKEELVAVVTIESQTVKLDIAYSNQEVADIGEDSAEWRS